MRLYSKYSSMCESMPDGRDSITIKCNVLPQVYRRHIECHRTSRHEIYQFLVPLFFSLFLSSSWALQAHIMPSSNQFGSI